MGRLSIIWPVLAGEWRRKLRVITSVGALMLTGIGAMWGVYVETRNAPWIFVVAILFGLLTLGFVWVCDIPRMIVPLAKGTGHASMEFRGEDLSYDPGTGLPILELHRQNISSLVLHDREIRLTTQEPVIFRGKVLRRQRARNIRVKLPGPTEAVWLFEVLKRWHAV